MTLREFIGLLWRHWYIMLASLLIVAVATVMMVRDGGIYTSRTLVQFTWPGAATITRYSGVDDGSVISFAKSIITQVNGGRSDTQYYSHIDAPIYGAGLRDAVVVTLRDDGSQWNSDINTAVVEIQIVGRSTEWVSAQQEITIAKIEGLAETEQSLMKVPEKDRIAVHVEPLTREVAFVEPSRSAKIAAFAAMGAVGFIGGAGVSWSIDRLRTRRRSSAPRTSRAGWAEVAA